jgi:hypothetical protein
VTDQLIAERTANALSLRINSESWPGRQTVHRPVACLRKMPDLSDMAVPSPATPRGARPPRDQYANGPVGLSNFLVRGVFDLAGLMFDQVGRLLL